MQHELKLEGPAYRLRPIGDDDAALVIELRSDPALNRYLHPSSNRLEDQLAWFANYYQRDNDFYFVIEKCRDNKPEGVVAIYEVDCTARSGEWGRWILKSSSLAAVESTYLIYRTAFELLGLESVYCRTVADNEQVVSFHDSCGIACRQTLPQYFNFNNKVFDAIEHRLNRAGWVNVEPRLAKLAQLTARKVHRG